ncbi:fatty-acid amide hydrolase [Ilyonectria sp. MPI-CAGE-AT-0026]|nr:fatty-acid amide hydrolase [Ilyonectria sp. MPI-CAGE-AT-0026]
MASQSSITSSSGDWETRAAEKRASCHKAIPEAWILPSSLLETLPDRSELSKTKTNLMSLEILRCSGILTERELQITESYTVSELLESLASGKLTSSEVTLAFSKRAAIAQQLTGCLTETFFQQAQERVQYLDDLRGKGRLVGPLHGLPVSIKDTYHVKGTQATIGVVAFLDRTSKENSALVDILLRLGAVLYVKTNVSQMLMSADSDNNIFGRVLNPWNTMLGAGGSSGGEGALVAFRGSPLGVGTDLAGSIRIPSLCCGTYGFKPSAGRIAFGGQQMPDNLGLGAIVASAGPLTNDINSLGIFMKAVIDTRPFRLDATVIDIPWRDIDGPPGPKLRLGLLPESPLFPLHPPVKETMEKAVQILQSHGHDVVTLDAAECYVAAAGEVARGILALDKTWAKSITSNGEPFIPSLMAMSKELRVIEPSFLPDLGVMDGLQRFETLQTKRAEITEAWRKLWAKHQLDAVISPVAQNTAVEHDAFGYPAYTAFLNLLDYPACVIPFHKAKASGMGFTKKPGQCAPAYKPDVVEGAPCAIQVFTSRMRDEECLAAAGIIDSCLRKASG